VIYLDFMASTPVDPRVASAMQRSLIDHVANPHASHKGGREALEAVETAASQVARAINVDASEITFTSGASEANNMALKGTAFAAGARGKHLVVSAIEHACVLEAARWLEDHGFEVTTVAAGPAGVVTVENVLSAIRDDTILVSVQLANNEIGTIQPVAEIASHCRERGIVVHSDAAQAMGKIPVDASALGVDLLSMSAHKMYGPKGIGALWVASDSPIRPTPLIHGGGQQGGRRSGTVPTFLCVGFGVAATQIAQSDFFQKSTAARHAALFVGLLRERLPNMKENASGSNKVPGCVSLRFPGAQAIDVLDQLQHDVAASTGSACSTGSPQPSHVLTGIGLDHHEARETVRFGFGRTTTDREIRQAAAFVVDAVHRARRLAA